MFRVMPSLMLPTTAPPCPCAPPLPPPQVRQTLQGQQIPRNLLNEHPNPPVRPAGVTPAPVLPCLAVSRGTALVQGWL